MNSTIDEMDRAVESLNARMASVRGGFALRPPPENGNAMDRRAEFERRYRELCDELGYEMSPDWSTVAFRADEARDKIDRERPFHDGMVRRLDSDDVEVPIVPVKI